MLEGIPKISVLVITYKQEELIKRAINSLLKQRDYIYEICVSDDCSPDGTWEVLQQYDKQYPGLFKLQRHPQNVGIFENLESTWSMPSGDMIYRLAGDDECGDGWFKTVVDFIRENKIDYKNRRVCIYGNYQCIYPNGDTTIRRNDAVLTGVSPFRLSFRHLIDNRSTCYSKAILDNFQKVSQGRSYVVETAQDIQLQIYSEDNYYIPYVGNIYYTRIGVSVNMNKDETDEHIEVQKFAVQTAMKAGVVFEQKDIYYSEFSIALLELKKKKTIGGIIKASRLFFKSHDSRIGRNGRMFKRVLFAMVRRLPHKKPLTWNI